MFVEGEDAEDGYVKSNYEAYINGDILSVVIKMDYIYDDMPVTPVYYYTFNINLDTKERVEFEELCEVAGFDKDNIDSSVLATLMENEESKYIPKEDKETGETVPYAVKKYKENSKTNRFICFVNIVCNQMILFRML